MHATKDANALPSSEEVVVVLLLVLLIGGPAKNAPTSHFRQTASIASDRA